MTTVITMGIILTVLLATLWYCSYAHWSVKATTLSVLILCGISATDHYNNSLGAPIEDYPPDGFVYVGHELTSDGSIVIWTSITDKGFRLYKIPYDRETAKELERARDSKGNGGDMEGAFGPSSNGDGSQSLEFNEVPVHEQGEDKN